MVLGAAAQMSEIVAGLYIGSIRNSRNEASMRANGITHVLSVHDVDTGGSRKEQQPAGRPRTNLRIHTRDADDEKLAPHLTTCCRFIHGARLRGGRVLVHCYDGQSRSV